LTHVRSLRDKEMHVRHCSEIRDPISSTFVFVVEEFNSTQSKVACFPLVMWGVVCTACRIDYL
jgi:hypothetical protein